MKLSMFPVLTVTMLLLIGGISSADPTPVGSLPMEIGTVVPSEEPVAINLSDINAPEFMDKIPAMKNMLLYSVRDNSWKYASMFDLLKWKGLALSAGYSPSDAVIAGVSYDLVSLKKFGVETPILKEVGLEPMVWYGIGRIDLHDTSDAEESWGIGLNIINIRFF